MNDHVGGLLQPFPGIGGNFHAPRGVLCPDDFAQVTRNLRRVGVDGGDDFNGLFFAHQTRDGGPDGADTILDGANFLFHEVLRPFAVRAHTAPFGLKRNPYDNGISARIQRRTAAGWPELLPERRFRRIIARENARPSRRKTSSREESFPMLKSRRCCPRGKAWASSTGNST